MRRLFIEPIDVLMFRAERPFIARETHIAKTGVISPLTFEGAIKSKILTEFCRRKGLSPRDFQRVRRREETPEDFERTKEELIGFVRRKMEDKEVKGLLEVIGYSPLKLPSKLNVLGVFFAKKNEFMEYFPVPNDIVKEGRKNGDPVKLQLKEGLHFEWMNRKICIGTTSYSQVESIDGLMDFNSLRNYLNGSCPKHDEIKRKPYFKEIRLGIELESSRKRTVEGALYTAEFLRLIENWGFVVWYECDDDLLPDKGLIKLGGEGKGAIFRKIDDRKLDWGDLIKGINKDKKFKLYLATPSYLGGCVPPEDRLEEALGVKLKLAAAFPGKPVYVGGYDFALNMEKPLRRWVNAGATFYYKVEGEGKIKEDLTLPLKILDKDINLGCAFIGRW